MGESLSIILDADGMLADVDRDELVHAQLEAVGVLAGGTTGGMPSVMARIALPDGRTAFAETTLRLLLSAADAFVARHGDPRYPDTPDRIAAVPSLVELIAGIEAVMQAAEQAGQEGATTYLELLPDELRVEDVAQAQLGYVEAYSHLLREHGAAPEEVLGGTWLAGLLLGVTWGEARARARTGPQEDDRG